MRKPPNLLVLSYFHPPAATGVRRLVSLLRHLPDHGWRPLVVCCRETAGSGHDESPLADPRVSGTPVVRTGSLDPYRVKAALGRGRVAGASQGARTGGGFGPEVMTLLRRHVFLPDDRMGWIPYAASAGIRLAARHRFQAVYSSSYPQSAHIAAMIVSARTGLPWLADFRDGWTQNPAFHDPGNPLLRTAQSALERMTARRATRIVTVSPPITRHLQRHRPGHLEPVATVYNGFEPTEYPSATGFSREPLHPGKLTLLYTGTFFGRRSPRPFLAALRVLAAHRSMWRDILRVRLRAELEAGDRRLIEEWSLGDMVEVLPPVDFALCQEEQRRADACLLVLESGPGSEIMVSQKVFEYLAAERPVFAMVPEGAAAELLRETGGAALSVGETARAAGAGLGRFLSAVRAGRFERASAGKLAEFHRSRQAAGIAAILDGMGG